LGQGLAQQERRVFGAIEVQDGEIDMTSEDTQVQTEAPRGNSVAVRPRATELMTADGKTSIADVVVAKIASIAAREIPGVHELVGQGMGGAVSGLAQRTGLAARAHMDNRPQGVNVEVGEREAAIDLRLTVEYGISIPETAESVRRNIMNRMQSMTGLVVKEVNIDVIDLYFPEEEQAAAPERRVE
jgi:uncharacterized alkaline shock family protein YloU